MRRPKTARPSPSTRPTRRSNELSLPVVKAKDIKRPSTWVFYGLAGTGKTTLACTFPKPLLLVDIQDEGTDSISDVEGVDVFQAESWADLEQVYWSLASTKHGYKTVVIDTLTQAQDVLIEEIGKNKRLAKGKQLTDWGVLTQREWGEVSGRIKSWISDMKGLGIEVVILAQNRIFDAFEDEHSTAEIEPHGGPRAAPSISDHVTAEAFVVGNTVTVEHEVKEKRNGKTITNKEIRYGLRLGPHRTYITKMRKPQSITLPSYILDPTYQKLTDLSKGKSTNGSQNKKARRNKA